MLSRCLGAGHTIAVRDAVVAAERCDWRRSETVAAAWSPQRIAIALPKFPPGLRRGVVLATWRWLSGLQCRRELGVSVPSLTRSARSDQKAVCHLPKGDD